MICPEVLVGRFQVGLIRLKAIRLSPSNWFGPIGKRRFSAWVASWLLISLLLISLLLPCAPSAAMGLATASAGSTIQVASMTLPSQIFKRWTHSREEDQGEVLVYRPSDYPFPPARGREGLEFRQDGEFIRYEIGATDRSQGVVGRWSLERANVVRVEFSQRSAHSLIILECNDQILKVRQQDS
ncbi:MAG: hypothetical protein ACKO7W_22880 [Elainella sp.]